MGRAISWFASLGLTVCVPLTDNQDYDLIVEDEVGLHRVQVKTTYCRDRNERFQVNLKTMGGNKTGTTVKNFDPESCDILFVLTDDNEIYIIPTSEISSKTSLTLGNKWHEYRK